MAPRAVRKGNNGKKRGVVATAVAEETTTKRQRRLSEKAMQSETTVRTSRTRARTRSSDATPIISEMATVDEGTPICDDVATVDNGDAPDGVATDDIQPEGESTQTDIVGPCRRVDTPEEIQEQTERTSPVVDRPVPAVGESIAECNESINVTVTQPAQSAVSKEIIPEEDDDGKCVGLGKPQPVDACHVDCVEPRDSDGDIKVRALRPVGDVVQPMGKSMEEMVKAIGERVLKEVKDVVKKELEDKWEKERMELHDMIHCLQCQLDDRAGTVNAMENRLRPLKKMMGQGAHRKCLTKNIVSTFFAVMTKGKDRSFVRKLNDVAKVVRMLLHSSNVGGKKDHKGDSDHHEVESQHVMFRKRVTWNLINGMQSNPKVGVTVVSVGDKFKRIEKPFWMKNGYTVKKDVNMFFEGEHKRLKKAKPNVKGISHELFQQNLVTEVIRTVNDFNCNTFNKVRERVRKDMMCEVLFLLENPKSLEVHFLYEVRPKGITEEFDWKDIPIMNISKLGDKDKTKVAAKLWKTILGNVGDRFTYIVVYRVGVYDVEENQDRELRREINLMKVSMLFLMRLTGTGCMASLFCYHENILHVIVRLAELFSYILTCHIEKRLKGRIDEVTGDEEDYDILRSVNVMRPTRSKTREDMLGINDEGILIMTEETFWKLMVPKEEVVEVEEVASVEPEDDIVEEDYEDEIDFFSAE